MIIASAACDQSNPSVVQPPASRGFGPLFIQQGTKRKLNFPNAEAEASVIYRDPVQGVKDATGLCRFPNLGKMRVGLMAMVGEWDTETCVGLLYYFTNDTRNTRPPSQTGDTARPDSVQASGQSGAEFAVAPPRKHTTKYAPYIRVIDRIPITARRNALGQCNWPEVATKALNDYMASHPEKIPGRGAALSDYDEDTCKGMVSVTVDPPWLQARPMRADTVVVRSPKR